MTNNINKVDELFSKTMINKKCHRSDNHEHKTVYIIKFTDLLMARELFRLRFHDSCTVTCKKTNTVKTSGQKRTYIWQQGNKQKRNETTRTQPQTRQGLPLPCKIISKARAKARAAILAMPCSPCSSDAGKLPRHVCE